jgi:hypothetical protein
VQIKSRIKALVTAVLFVVTGAATVFACQSGGNGATSCSSSASVWVLWTDSCSTVCGSGAYACCDSGTACVCIASGH